MVMAIPSARETYAIGGARQSIEERVAKALDGPTPERYQQFVNKQRADVPSAMPSWRHQGALRDPQTIEQFKTFLKYRSLDKLTPSSAPRYEDLIAASNLDKRSGPRGEGCHRRDPDRQRRHYQNQAHQERGRPLCGYNGRPG